MNFDFWPNTNGCVLSAEIGINANGDEKIAKSLIMNASLAGWNLIKFQKRHVSVDSGCYRKEFLLSSRESKWGTTQYDQKIGLEFSEEWGDIVAYCDELGMNWYASVWDKESVNFLEGYGIKAYKIPSAVLTNIELLDYVVSKGKPVVLSTGMHTDEETERAIEIFHDRVPLMLLYCVAVYPCDVRELDFTEMAKLKYCYPDCSVGYSGHETELSPSILAKAMGAEMIERHITLDRNMYGSDQKAALEFNEMVLLHRLISEKQAEWPRCAFDCKARVISDTERSVRDKFIQQMRNIQ